VSDKITGAPSWPKVLAATHVYVDARRRGDTAAEAVAARDREAAIAVCEAELATATDDQSSLTIKQPSHKSTVAPAKSGSDGEGLQATLHKQPVASVKSDSDTKAPRRSTDSYLTKTAQKSPEKTSTAQKQTEKLSAPPVVKPVHKGDGKHVRRKLIADAVKKGSKSTAKPSKPAKKKAKTPKKAAKKTAKKQSKRKTKK